MAPRTRVVELDAKTSHLEPTGLSVIFAEVLWIHEVLWLLQTLVVLGPLSLGSPPHPHLSCTHTFPTLSGLHCCLNKYLWSNQTPGPGLCWTILFCLLVPQDQGCCETDEHLRPGPSWTRSVPTAFPPLFSFLFYFTFSSSICQGF